MSGVKSNEALHEN